MPKCPWPGGRTDFHGVRNQQAEPFKDAPVLRYSQITLQNQLPRTNMSPNSATLNPITAPSGGAQWRLRRDCGAMSWKMR